MASCPRCFQEKEMFATRCPHCVADVPVSNQLNHSLITTIIVWVVIFSVLFYIFG